MKDVELLSLTRDSADKCERENADGLQSVMIVMVRSSAKALTLCSDDWKDLVVFEQLEEKTGGCNERGNLKTYEHNYNELSANQSLLMAYPNKRDKHFPQKYILKLSTDTSH